MSESIKKSVGKKGTNDAADVMIVQARLNVYVAANLLGPRAPLAMDGNAAATVPYIEDFQRLVMGNGNPDGTVDPLPKPTMTQLMKDPGPGLLASAKIHLMAFAHLAKGPFGGVRPEAWSKALWSLIHFSSHPKLTRPHLMTVVDFGISNKTPRLWTLNLESEKVLYNTWVAHGGGPKDAKGNPICRQYEVPTRLEDGNRFSSVGAYITAGVHSSDLGNLNNQPAMKVIGLEKGINGRSQERGVLFHGADYVKSSSVGNSWGCFATKPDVNPSLVADIKNGSFVYAYHEAFSTTAT